MSYLFLLPAYYIYFPVPSAIFARSNTICAFLYIIFLLFLPYHRKILPPVTKLSLRSFNSLLILLSRPSHLHVCPISSYFHITHIFLFIFIISYISVSQSRSLFLFEIFFYLSNNIPLLFFESMYFSN